MSQSSFLDTVAHWSPEECQQNLDQTLPKLVNQVQNAPNHDIVSLKLLCELFVPVCHPQRLEEEVFSQIHHKITEQNSSLYAELCSVVTQTSLAIEEMKRLVIELLQDCVEMVVCVEHCVSGLCQTERPLEMTYLHSFTPVILNVINTSYNHCKDSSQIYGELLGMLTEHLSTLFKKTHALQTSFINLLDRVNLSQEETGISDFCTVLERLHEISTVAVCLDVKVMVVIWKAISKLACQHKQLLYNRLDIDPMLSSLATDMTSSFTYMVQIVHSGHQGDDKAFAKSVKVLGFQMKVLVTLVKDYKDCLDNCVPTIVNLLLIVQGHLPPSELHSQISKHHGDEIQKQVGVAMDPLVSYLIPHQRFIQTLTAVHKGDDFTQWLPLCMTLITVIKMLPNHSEEIQTAWISPILYPEDESRLTLLKAIFMTVPKCYVELCLPASLPGVMCRGKPQRRVGLYEYICTHLCGFVATHSVKHFKNLEDCLLENVLSEDLHSFLLACDMWCFLARYGTADLCRDHCVFLVRLLAAARWAPTVQCCHLVITLRRLLKFLAPEHQASFLQTFPLEEHLPLYTLLPVAVFPESSQQSFTLRLVELCVNEHNLWLQAQSVTPAQAHKLTLCNRALCNFLSSSDAAQTYIQHDLQMTLVHRLCRCAESLSPGDVERFTVLQSLAATVAEALAIMSDSLDSPTILQVLERLSSWLRITDVEMSVKMSVVHFLKSLGTKKFPVSSQQPRILQILPKMFSALLSDSSVVVHQVAVDNFAQFAEETVHEDIVPESLKTDDKTQTAVVAYLNQLANGAASVNPDIHMLKLQQNMLEIHLESVKNQSETEAVDMDCSEPLRKKQKTDEGHNHDGNNCNGNNHDGKQDTSNLLQDNHYEKTSREMTGAVRTLRSGLDSLSASRVHRNNIPPSVLAELRQIHAELSCILEPH